MLDFFNIPQYIIGVLISENKEKFMYKKLLILLVIFCSGQLAAEVSVASSFGDNMVIQREMRVPVWGTAAAGEVVTVSFDGQKLAAKADDSGKWLIRLAPMRANTKAQDMTISGSTNRITLKNILIGEVWLCSGQSNMQMPMWSDRPLWRAYNGDKDAAAGANPLIRVVAMPCKWSALPVDNEPVKWVELDVENGKKFSAAAFYFGQELFKDLQIPVGLIAASWGATRIEPWISPAGFGSVPELKDFAFQVDSKRPGTPEYNAAAAKMKKMYSEYYAALEKAAETGSVLPAPPTFPQELNPPADHQAPTVLFNRMIYPFVPMALRGVIWYQGCANRKDGMIYRHKMQALLNGWRREFGQAEMPFYFVQLAPFIYKDESPYNLPELWEAQEVFAGENKNVKMAVINDIGDWGDIHPHNKSDVGKRLAALALKYTYGKSGIKADFPSLSGWKIEKNRFVLSFDFVQKWQSRGAVSGFEVAGAAGNWVAAKAEIVGDKLVVYSPEVRKPFYLRYLWHQKSKGELFNESGLPLGAFRIGKKAGKSDVFADLESSAKLIYQANLLALTDAQGKVVYQLDNASKYAGKRPKRIIYTVELTPKGGEEKWVAAGMDAFVNAVDKSAFPVPGGDFAGRVTNLYVTSNHPEIRNGLFYEGNIEFLPGDYYGGNRFGIPGASDRFYDWGDHPGDQTVNGYGSMQIHNHFAQQTVFACNNFRNKVSDLGIGNAPGRHRDWTYAANSRTYSRAVLKIYAVFE